MENFKNVDTLGTKRSSNCQNYQVHIQVLACGLNLSRSKEIGITRQSSEDAVPYAFLALSLLQRHLTSCKSVSKKSPSLTLLGFHSCSK